MNKNGVGIYEYKCIGRKIHETMLCILTRAAGEEPLVTGAGVWQVGACVAPRQTVSEPCARAVITPAALRVVSALLAGAEEVALRPT